jgi:hypothetical protein
LCVKGGRERKGDGEGEEEGRRRGRARGKPLSVRCVSVPCADVFLAEFLTTNKIVCKRRGRGRGREREEGRGKEERKGESKGKPLSVRCVMSLVLMCSSRNF